MNLLYNYFDYEEAYFHMRYYDCKKIGLYLLAKLKDKRAKELYKRLLKFEYDWMTFDKTDADLLWDVKVWLMVNDNYF